MEKPLLSICMMVKDEENNLDRCLQSLIILLQNNCELIIVDTGSTDKTVEIAKKYTKNIYFKKWENNFSEIRNYSISLAKSDWVLIIDADEEIENAELIFEGIELANRDGFDVISVEVKNLQDENSKDTYVLNISPRIFRNNGKFKYIGAVHNQPVISGPILVTNISFLHYGYIYKNKDIVEKKFKRTAKILKDELEKNPKDIYYQYQLGVSYDFYGDRNQAAVEFEKAYKLLQESNAAIKKGYILVYGIYSRTLYSLGRFYKAIEITKEGLELVPDYVDLYYILGYSLLKIGNYEEGIKYLKKYITLAQNLEQLSIYDDAKIIFYHVSPFFINMVLKDISTYYMNENDYENAGFYINKISNLNIKNRLFCELLYSKKDYKGLLNFYNNLDAEKKEIVVEILETNLLNNPETDEYYNIFSNVNDEYGTFCKVMVDRIKIDELDNWFDYNNLPIYFFKIFKKINDVSKIVDIIVKIESSNRLRNIFNHLIQWNILSEEKVLNILSVIENHNNPISLRIYIDISIVLILYWSTNKITINLNRLDIFMKYLQKGYEYLTSCLKLNEAIGNISVLEDEYKIFAIYGNIKQSLHSADLKGAIKGFRFIMQIENNFAPFVEKIMEEIN